MEEGVSPQLWAVEQLHDVLGSFYPEKPQKDIAAISKNVGSVASRQKWLEDAIIDIVSVMSEI